MPDPISTEAFPSKDVAAGHAPTLNETSAFTPTHGGMPAHPSSTEDPLIGTTIGRYTLLKKLGEGGMGSVYLADQSEPVKRQVALKLIRGNVDSRSILTRFEAERQALAVMDHPNIARIYDGGTSSSLQPFFVMELVQGIPITEYCDQHRLSLKQRLELFVPICQAVQHAHQKGVIHRDLKPSNVLVTEVDGKPVPKVIDFGVAKATEQPLTDQSIGDTGAIVGTPTYMSPEQADPMSMDIDTRTDIYALGVMLYELLTGSTPIDAKQFRRGALLEMLRMVQEVDPPRPSTKLSTAEALPSIAANRNIEPKQLQAMLRGDVDWIVMKALEKDRTRRYETANGFAADVQRYLTGDAVLAHPPSRWYLMKKFVKRNRVQVIAAGLVTLALIGGIIGTSLGLIEANRARHAESERAEGERQSKIAAQQAAVSERKAREDEAAANAQSQKRLEQLQKGNEIIAGIFTDLDIREIKKGNKPLEAVLADRLVNAAGQLEGESIASPTIVAELQNRLGTSLLSLGFAPQAIPLIEKSRTLRAKLLGVDHPETLASMNTLAKAYKDDGQLELALSLFKETLKRRKATLGLDHPDTLGSMNVLAGGYLATGKLELALPLFEETLKLRKAKLGLEHNDTHESMNNLAVGYQNVGKLDLALPLFQETYKLRKAKLGPTHPDVLSSMFNLAVNSWALGKLELALPLFEETLKLRKSRLGPDHPDTLESMNSMAMGYEDTGKLDLALPLFEETLKLRKAKLGLDHPDTLSSMNNLAAAYQHASKTALALPLFEETLLLTKAKLGPEHPDTLSSMNNLAGIYRSSGKNDQALKLFDETLKIIKAKLGPDHPNTLTSMSNLAEAYKAVGKHDMALQLYDETLRLRKAKLGPDHPDSLVSLNNLAVGYQAAGKIEESLPFYEEAFKRMKAKLGPDHPNILDSMNNLGNAYCAAKQGEKAKTVFTDLLVMQCKRLSKDSPELLDNMSSIAANFLKAGQFIPAEELLRECLLIREKTQPNVWTTFNTKTLLGGALLGQKKYSEAEPMLIKGYEGMKQREKAIPPQDSARIPEALDRLIQLYTETNKPDEVKKWQVEKEKSPKPVEK